MEEESKQTPSVKYEDIESADVRIPVRDGEIPGYRAMPAGAGPFPIVLIAPEIFGVNENIRQICRRFAGEGYFAIAPDFFVRQGDVSQMTDHQEIISKVISKLSDAQVLSDLDAAADYAASTGKGDITRLTMTGFCWGGRIAWLYAAQSDRLRAAVAWYGKVVGDRDELHPRHPLDVVGDLKCPILALHGGKDRSIPIDSLYQLREALIASDKTWELVVFPEAGHGFFADYRPSYNPVAAEKGWQKLLDWFAAHAETHPKQDAAS